MRNGGLLIEVNGGAEYAELVRRKVEQAMGSGASVRKTENRRLVEILDLDGMASSEEITEAISHETEVEKSELKILSVRRTFGGGQAAAVLVLDAAAVKTIQVGRLRVGLVYTRVRESDASSAWHLATYQVSAWTAPIGETPVEDVARSGTKRRIAPLLLRNREHSKKSLTRSTAGPKA